MPVKEVKDSKEQKLMFSLQVVIVQPDWFEGGKRTTRNKS